MTTTTKKKRIGISLRIKTQENEEGKTKNM